MSGQTCLRCDAPIGTALYVEVEGPPEANAPPTVAGSVCRTCAGEVARSLGFVWDDTSAAGGADS